MTYERDASLEHDEGQRSEQRAQSASSPACPEGLDALVLAQLVAEAQARARAGHAAARRPRRPPPRRARARACLLRAQRARHLRSPPGTRCPTTASVPTRRSWPSASRRSPSWRSARASTRPSCSPPSTPSCSACRRAQLPQARHQADRRRPAHRHGAPDAAARRSWATSRSGTVMEPGEYAVRGGILDLFPPGRASPVRLDFFGDTLESIKAFEVQTQRTTKPVQKLAHAAGERGRVRRGGREAVPRPLRGAVRRRDRRRPAVRGRSAPASAIRARSIGCRCSTSTWRRCSTICRACR